MKFYIELANSKVCFRLKADRSWRKKGLHNHKIKESDFMTGDIYELVQIQQINTNIHLNGKDWYVNQTGGYHANSLEYRIFTIRVNKPLMPSRDQLISVLAQGDDRITNVLILNVHGFFELRYIGTINSLIKDPAIVMRYMTFPSRSGCVGPKVVKISKYIDVIYSDSLLYWADHLETGKTNYYCDAHKNMPIKFKTQYIEEIEI